MSSRNTIRNISTGPAMGEFAYDLALRPDCPDEPQYDGYRREDDPSIPERSFWGEPVEGDELLAQNDGEDRG